MLKIVFLFSNIYVYKNEAQLFKLREIYFTAITYKKVKTCNGLLSIVVENSK